MPRVVELLGEARSIVDELGTALEGSDCALLFRVPGCSCSSAGDTGCSAFCRIGAIADRLGCSITPKAAYELIAAATRTLAWLAETLGRLERQPPIVYRLGRRGEQRRAALERIVSELQAPLYRLSILINLS